MRQIPPLLPLTTPYESGRRYGDFVDLLTPFQETQCVDAKQEVLGETVWNKLRLIIAHDPQVALDAGNKRDNKIAALEQQAADWTGKLDEQEIGKKKRGRKLSDGGARARFTTRYATPIWRASFG